MTDEVARTGGPVTERKRKVAGSAGSLILDRPLRQGQTRSCQGSLDIFRAEPGRIEFHQQFLLTRLGCDPQNPIGSIDIGDALHERLVERRRKRERELNFCHGSLRQFGGAFELSPQSGQQIFLTAIERSARIRRFVRFEPQADQIGDLFGNGFLRSGLESQRNLRIFERF